MNDLGNFPILWISSLSVVNVNCQLYFVFCANKHGWLKQQRLYPLNFKEIKGRLKGKTHRLIDTLAEDGEDENSGDRWREVAGDGLDVVEELTTLG